MWSRFQTRHDPSLRPVATGRDLRSETCAWLAGQIVRPGDVMLNEDLLGLDSDWMARAACVAVRATGGSGATSRPRSVLPRLRFGATVSGVRGRRESPKACGPVGSAPRAVQDVESR